MPWRPIEGIALVVMETKVNQAHCRIPRNSGKNHSETGMIHIPCTRQLHGGLDICLLRCILFPVRNTMSSNISGRNLSGMIIRNSISRLQTSTSNLYRVAILLDRLPKITIRGVIWTMGIGWYTVMRLQMTVLHPNRSIIEAGQFRMRISVRPTSPIRALPSG